MAPRSRSGFIEDAEERLRLFDATTERIMAGQAPQPPRPADPKRGWTRDEFYLDERGLLRGLPR